MILVDDRESAANRPTDRRKDIEKLVAGRCEVVSERLQFADVAFKGNGSEGDALIGIELKSVQDCLACIESARFASHQLPGLVSAYDKVYLVVEGRYRSGPAGVLQVERWEGHHTVWKHPNPFARKHTLWSAFEHWLRSMEELGGVTVVHVADRKETAQWVAATWEWWNRPWEAHKSLRAVQKPGGTAFYRFNEVEKHAAVLPGVGYERALLVGKHFCCVRHMIAASAKEWTRIEGIGKVTACKIVDSVSRCREKEEL